MTIKKSFLESKWYYRVAKVIFVWIIPLLVGATALLLATANTNGTSIFYLAVGLVLYFLILKGIWRGFLYIAFGGLENDMDKKADAVAKPATISNATVTPAPVASALNQSDKNQIVGWILTLIMIGAIYYAYFIYKSPPPIPDVGPGGGKSTACIPTGCGTAWRCNGSYYSDGVKRSINACYSSKTQATTLPSWTGTCRQCP